jgi:hypothetical protein
MKWHNPLYRMIDFQHILTPLAVERFTVRVGLLTLSVRIIYIFGVKVAYFNVSPFENR